MAILEEETYGQTSYFQSKLRCNDLGDVENPILGVEMPETYLLGTLNQPEEKVEKKSQPWFMNE
jgi:hypothetical protein